MPSNPENSSYQVALTQCPLTCFLCPNDIFTSQHHSPLLPRCQSLSLSLIPCILQKWNHPLSTDITRNKQRYTSQNIHTVILIGNLQKKKSVLKMNGKIVPPIRDIINYLIFICFIIINLQIIYTGQKNEELRAWQDQLEV